MNKTRWDKKVFKKWIWKCPHEGCEAQSRMKSNWHKSARHGRNHLRNIHNDVESQPIVIMVGCGEENASELSGMQKKDKDKETT